MPQAIDDDPSAFKIVKQRLPFQRRSGDMVDLIWDAAPPFAEQFVAFHRVMMAGAVAERSVLLGAKY